MASRVIGILYKIRPVSAYCPLLASKNGSLNVFPILSNLMIKERLQMNTVLHTKEQIRYTSFLITLSAEQLWKGVSSVSNPGKKRGRGKRLKKFPSKNLNRGQVIGVGKSNMIWPGLTTPIIKGKEIVERSQLPPDPEFEQKIIKVREEQQRSRRLRITPMERGWTGGKLGGSSIGPPDPIGEDTFDGFDTKVIEFKTVTNMQSTSGRVRRLSAFVVTGNKNGLAGYALAKAPDRTAALKKAKNRAGQNLFYIERYNNHTIQHNFFAQMGKTKIYAFKKPEGFGLVCHRALKCICEMIGIKDMYAKVEGSTKNYQCLTKAFFHGLVNQKTHQMMADEVGLNIVEFRAENDYFPTLIASPTSKLPLEEQEKKKIDYEEYLSNGNVVLKKKKHPPFYVGTKGWEIHLKKTVFKRNHKKVQLKMLSREGEVKSFLTDKSPEELPKIIGVGRPCAAAMSEKS